MCVVSLKNLAGVYVANRDSNSIVLVMELFLKVMDMVYINNMQYIIIFPAGIEHLFGIRATLLLERADCF